MNLGKPLRAGFVTVATIALLLAAGPAFAHAHLLSEDPAAADKADASAPSAPVTELRLTFSEELNAAFSKVQLKDSMGMAVDGTAVALDPKDPKVIVVTLAAPLAKGEYEVDWTAVSNDGHKTTGTYKVNVAQ